MPGGTSANQHKGNDIHIKTGCALHYRIRADSAKLVRNHRTADENIIADFNMTANRDIIGKYGVIPDRAIMRDMAVIHKETT
jgi:hypothetical protein